jgi:acetylornithine deacetylase/succinyl-diaminopimelate desuccinylase-like protein
MTRQAAINRAQSAFDDGSFKTTLQSRIERPTESQNPARQADLLAYLSDALQPAFEAMGFECQQLTHPKAKAPFLYAQRIESPHLPTVLGYGHGDVIRGLESEWREGVSPWALTELDGRWYGRGIADNKGQHSVNLQAMACVLAERGYLGFNAKYLIEMGEETGSPGLKELCQDHADLFKADLLIASDGPRLSAERPTIFLGSRGCINFDLSIESRAGAHHSGNWGGLISNPGIQLAHAISCVVSERGEIKVPEWKPSALPDAVRRVLADCQVDGGANGPAIEADWGQPGLSPAERVFGWSSFEVLAFKTGNPDNPVNAIPPRAKATCQLHFGSAEASPRPQRFFVCANYGRPRRSIQSDSNRSRRCLGHLGCTFIASHHPKIAGHFAQFGRLLAQRYFYGCARFENRMGTTFIPGLLTACAQ